MKNNFEVISNESLEISEYLVRIRRLENPGIAVCLSAYNEPLRTIEATLNSIANNIRYLAAESKIGKTVAIVLVDGMHNADSKLVDLLRTGQVDTLDSSESGLVHLSCRHYRDLFPEAEHTPSFEIVLCVKDQSQGKLNSHKVFFKEICYALSPTYCMQIDAGSVMMPNCFSIFLKEFENRPNIKALGANILAAEPSERSLLTDMQVGEFIAQGVVAWPSEVAFGFLSVTPGQCSVVRWSEMAAPCQDQDDTTTIDRYLNNADQNGTLRELMYLAEDRVVTFELLRNSDRASDGINQTSFCPDAINYTDSCESADELFRQRRRWINSGLSCRIWVMVKMIEWVITPWLSIKDRLRLSLYLFHASIMMLIEVFLPAIVIFLYLLSLENLTVTTQIIGVPESLANGMYFALAILAVMSMSSLLLIFTDRLKSYGNTLMSISLAAGIFVTGAGILVNTIPYFFNTLIGASIGQSPKEQIYVSAMILLNFCLMYLFSKSGRSDQTPKGSRAVYIIKYTLGYLAYKFALTVYAIKNLSDVSWGTKGLTKQRTLGNASNIWLSRAPIAIFATNFAVLFFVDKKYILGLLAIGAVFGTCGIIQHAIMSFRQRSTNFSG